jgi:hypothetical protein
VAGRPVHLPRCRAVSPDMPTIEDAIILAATAHRGQVDKSGEPYILHPLRVMQAVPAGDARLVAVLHDVVEDTPVELDELRRLGYSEAVVDAIDAISRRQGEAYFDFVRRAVDNPLARLVEREDIADNSKPERLRFMGAGAKSMLERYRKAMQIVEEAERVKSGQAVTDQR